MKLFLQQNAGLLRRWGLPYPLRQMLQAAPFKAGWLGGGNRRVFEVELLLRARGFHFHRVLWFARCSRYLDFARCGCFPSCEFQQYSSTLSFVPIRPHSDILLFYFSWPVVGVIGTVAGR